MAIKFKLSDEEKKKINKIATAMEEEKQTTRDTSSSQELPTASSKMKRKDDQKIYELPKAGFIANSRRTGEISNPFSDSRLINTLKKENETLKTAKEDLQPLGESSISSQTYEDMKSNDPKVSFPAKTRYLIDTAKGAITGWGKSIGQYLQTSVANDNQRVLDNKILAKFTDENGRKRLEETNKNLVEQIRKTQADKNADAIASQELSPTMQTLGNISRNLGNMAPTMALNALMPGTGNVAMFMSSSGDASGEELLKENNIQKAKLAGDLKGAIEVGAEKLTGGIKFLPKGTLDNTAVNFISKNIKSKVGQKIASKGYEVGGEVLEEVLTDIGQNTVDKFMYQDDGKVVDFDQLKETAKITVLTTLALNALGLGGSTYKEVQQQNKTNEVNSRINEAQKIINGDGYITQEQQTTNQANNNTNVERNLPTVNTENTYSNQLKQMASKEITNSNISEDYKTMMLDVLNSMNKVSDADISSIRQNINSLEDANNNKEKIRSILKRNGTFSEQIDKYVENKLPSGDFLYLGETPTILKKIGLNNEEMVLKQGKLKSIIKESSDGTDQMHGLPIETIKKIPEAIANPLNVLQSSSNKDSIVVITDLADTNERPIIASIEVNYNGQIGNIDFLSNRLTSAYGKNNYDRFMKTEIAKGNLLYDIDEGIIKELPTTRLQLPKGISSSVDTNNNISTINNSISQNNNSVKNTTTNNYMQKKQNNSNELETGKINNVINETRSSQNIQNSVEKNNIKEYNNLQLGETKNINTNDLSQLAKDGGHRTTEQIESLRESIRQNGIVEPIEIYRKNDGTFAIENGNHRLKIASELGIEQVPVKLVESWENIGVSTKNASKDFVQEYGGVYDDRITEKNSNIDEGRWNRERSRSGGNNQLEDSGRTRRNAEIYATKSYGNEQTSSVKNKGNNRKQEVEDSTSFNFSEDLNSKRNESNDLETGEWTKKKNLKEEQEKIATILEKPVKKVDEGSRIWAITKANLIDKGIVFEELSNKTNNRELQGKWDYTLTATARGQMAIGEARYEMNPKTKTEKQICKSLEDIRAEVGDKVKDFQYYMYHQLNIDRMTLEERFAGDTGINYERKEGIKNKPVFADSVTAELSREVVKQYEKQNPEFKDWAQDVYDYTNANKKELVESGVISQELSDKLSEMYPHYIPIKRVDTKGNAIKVPLDTNRTGINSPITKAKGGNQDIQPLFETLADRTLQTYKASARNNFGVELMKTLKTIQDTQTVDVDSILENIGDANNNAELLREGKNGNAPTFTVFDKGNKVTFEITRDMFDALKPVSDSSLLSKTIKPLNAISNARRGVLTEYNPLFLITNALKDAQDVVINSQHSAKTYAKFPEAYYQIIKKGYWYNEYVRNGGEQNSYFKDGKFESDKKSSKLKTALMMPLNKISSINNVIEMAPRLAEYIASRESGRSIETSMLDSARVTTNFKAGGDVTKFLNRNGATFLNASVQGFHQQVRNFKEAQVKGLKGYAVLATKYAVAGLPALILNSLLWSDDDDYEELQDYVKDNYYIIAKYGDGKFLRIPKGRMSATIQKLVGNVSEYITGEKELQIDNLAKDFWEDLKFTVDNIAPNNPLDNNVISPIIQAITNTSWYGEDIVPTRLQNKPKEEQYDETTDSLSILLGKQLKVSPYKINYLLDQYGGGISDVVLPMMTKQAENNVVEDKFTTDSVMKSKYPGEFYSKLDEITVAGNSDKASDNDILASKYASSISKEMSELYKEKREIQGSNLSDKEKKTKIKKVQEKINTLAKEGLKSLEDFKNNSSNTSNTATIGNEQYYKSTSVSDGVAKWYKVSKEDAEKIKNISLKTYADYKEKIAQETIKQRKDGTISEEQAIKSKDKIKILANSNYLNKEKTELYENYILSSEDKKYPIIKSTFTENGLNMSKYLQYKAQEFKTDKKDDGTVDGKSITGSKKDKVFDYIDSIKGATYTQKLILYALEYRPRNASDREIVENYVRNMPNRTVKEKLEIMSKFAGVTLNKPDKEFPDGSYDY